MHVSSNGILPSMMIKISGLVLSSSYEVRVCGTHPAGGATRIRVYRSLGQGRLLAERGAERADDMHIAGLELCPILGQAHAVVLPGSFAGSSPVHSGEASLPK